MFNLSLIFILAMLVAPLVIVSVCAYFIIRKKLRQSNPYFFDFEN